MHVSTILQQKRTDCLLLVMKEVGDCSSPTRCTSLVGPYVRDSSNPLYMSVTLEGPGTRPLKYNSSFSGRIYGQNLYESGIVASDGVFEQVSHMDATHFRMCNSSFSVRVWSGKPMYRHYRRLTEQSSVDMKETFVWLKATNLPGGCSRPNSWNSALWKPRPASRCLAACAVQAWRQSRNKKILTPVFFMISAVLQMAASVGRMLRSWQSMTTCE